MISYAVSLRTRELGIRMALGAARKDVLAMVLRQGLTFVGVGLVTGFATSLLMTRFLSSLLFQVHPVRPGDHAPCELDACCRGLAGQLSSGTPSVQGRSHGRVAL